MPFHGGRSPLTRGPGTDVFGIVSTRVRRDVTEPDFRARIGNHIDRDSKFARALPTVIFRAGALSNRLLQIASTLYIYRITLHHRMLLGEASRRVGVPITLTVSPRGNPPYSIAPYSSAMTVGRTRRIASGGSDRSRDARGPAKRLGRFLMPHTRGLADAFGDSVNGRSGAVAGIGAAL
jgi:hypothetical protein